MLCRRKRPDNRPNPFRLLRVQPNLHQPNPAFALRIRRKLQREQIIARIQKYRFQAIGQTHHAAALIQRKR